LFDDTLQTLPPGTAIFVLTDAVCAFDDEDICAMGRFGRQQ